MFGAGARILRVKSLTNIHKAIYHTFSFCTKGRNTRATAKYSNCLTKSTKHDFSQIKLFTMKKFFYTFFVVVFAIMALWSCTQDYTEMVSIIDDTSIQSQKVLRTITEDEAYGAIERFLEQIDPQTRGFKRTVPRGKMFTLRRSHVNRAISRGSQEDTPLLGFVNLSDNSNSFSRSDSSNLWNGGHGYAVVNYNPLLGDTILIVTDNGNIQEEDVIIDDNAEVPDSLQEQFAALYCEEDDDYYIGNVEETSITNVTVNFAWNYVHLRNDFIGDGDNDPIIDDSGDSGSGSGGSSGSGSSGNSGGDTSTNQPAIDTLELLEQMLKTHWGQDGPYNNDFHQGILNGEMVTRPAGCVTIAAAQILTYLKNVSLSEHFDITSSTWADLEMDFHMPIDIEDTTTVFPHGRNLEKVIKQMADGIGVKYNYNGTGGTFATPKMLQKYLKSIGCETNKHLGYGQNIEDRIIQSLNNNFPVFIAALNSKCHGHAWVIDGYRLLSNQPHYYTHCNMGWKGQADGWYYYGMFNTDNDLFERDDINDKKEFKYTMCFRTLFFD